MSSFFGRERQAVDDLLQFPLGAVVVHDGLVQRGGNHPAALADLGDEDPADLDVEDQLADGPVLPFVTLGVSVSHPLV